MQYGFFFSFVVSEHDFMAVMMEVPEYDLC